MPDNVLANSVGVVLDVAARVVVRDGTFAAADRPAQLQRRLEMFPGTSAVSGRTALAVSRYVAKL